MLPPDQYELLDFGQDEKLESFGGTVVRRETPSGFGTQRAAASWSHAALRYRLNGRQGPLQGEWQGQSPVAWKIQLGEIIFLLRTTPTGQIGVFPEQATNWNWIDSLPFDLNRIRAINLFAYTGGTTMALARRGAQVTHVDAAKSVVNWARLNAAESGLGDAPIRWIVEDALTFVEREIRRGNHYDAIVADPPSFGRGPHGEAWKIQRDFPQLLKQLAILTQHRPRLILISCHTPGITQHELKDMVADAFQIPWDSSDCFEMSIPSSAGNRLPSGICFRGTYS